MRLTTAWVLGTLTVGTLDALDAIVVFGLRSGATPTRIFQGIASGLLGSASFQGGSRSAWIGVLVHYTVAAGASAAYLLASRALPFLRKNPWITGPIYGIGFYFFMNLVVIPLSAIGASRFTVFGVTNGLLIHMFGVGLPCALFAARVSAPRGQ